MQSLKSYYFVLGYEAGCVGDNRYYKNTALAETLSEGMKLLRSIRLTRTKWKQGIERLGVKTALSDTSHDKLRYLTSDWSMTFL